jgi:hypothetical protein
MLFFLKSERECATWTKILRFGHSRMLNIYIYIYIALKNDCCTTLDTTFI